jgi:hypothetical protein
MKNIFTIRLVRILFILSFNLFLNLSMSKSKFNQPFLLKNTNIPVIISLQNFQYHNYNVSI